jgi:hypothetical protein
MLGGTGRASTVGWTRALLFTARLATLFNLPLAISAGWLLWRSLDWPLVGDATIFHFIAGQFQMGAIQYRDIFDVNMPFDLLRPRRGHSDRGHGHPRPARRTFRC